MHESYEAFIKNWSTLNLAQIMFGACWMWPNAENRLNNLREQTERQRVQIYNIMKVWFLRRNWERERERDRSKHKIVATQNALQRVCSKFHIYLCRKITFHIQNCAAEEKSNATFRYTQKIKSEIGRNDEKMIEIVDVSKGHSYFVISLFFPFTRSLDFLLLIKSNITSPITQVYR